MTARGSMADPVDELYTAPLRDFVARRTAIATRLREQGKTSQAKVLAAIGKPKATVWAINRVARTSPKTVQAVLTAFDRLKSTQLKQPAAVTEAAGAFRTAVERAAHAAIDALKQNEIATTLDTHRRIANTLRGAAATARPALVAGNLTKEETPGGFDVFEGAMPSGRRPVRAVASPKSAPPAAASRPARDDMALRRAAQLEVEAGTHEWDAQRASAAVAKAREQLRELQQKARTAARAAKTSRSVAERARRRASRA